MRDQGVLRERLGFAGHIQDHALPGCTVGGFTNGCGFQNVWMHHRHLLDFVGVHIETRYQNHVLDAIDDANEALCIHDRQIACLQESIGRHDRCSVLRALPVTLHDLGAPHTQFARFA